MERLGCKRDARKALRGELKYLNEGAYRTCYVDRRKRFVYKVDKRGADGKPYRSNAGDIRAYQRLSSSGCKGIAPTEAWLVDDGEIVLVQPLYDTLAADLMDDAGPEDDAFSFAESIVYEIAHDYGLHDMHEWNWAILEDGSPVIFDFGGHAYAG